jgi:serine/threonine-protein kinase PpkA
VIDDLTDAYAGELVHNLRDGDDARAREYLDHATRLGRETGTLDSAAQRKLRDDAANALQARIEQAAKRFDQKRAKAAAQLAPEFGLSPEVAKRLLAQADAIPQRGEMVPGDPSGAVLGTGGVAISRKPVNRNEYARFASLTGRAASLCRERASLLRVLAPRSWREPGFSQGASEPVVCVSLDDAEAYAKWYSRQTGHDYRLPTATESRQTAPEVSGRDLSLWLRDCGSDCSERKTLGSSWRSKQSDRTLDANRGYDDVGFRLVREL